MDRIFIAVVLAVAPLLGSATPLPLDYNWNGMVHTGEQGQPNASDGYRSISDRGLTLSVDGNSLTPTATGNTGLEYSFPTSANTVDTVFFGIRKEWDSVPDGDDFGIAPNWDPTGGTAELASAMTTFANPLTATADFTLGLLYNISNGGGTFDVNLVFDNGSVTVTLAGPDWFGVQPVDAPNSGVATQSRLAGPVSNELWGGVQARDLAQFGPALNLVEATVSANSLLTGLGFDVTGRSLTSIEFDNLTGIDTNLREGAVGIYAASVTGVPEPGTLALLGMGLAGTGFARKKMKA